MSTMQEIRKALAARISPALGKDWSVYAFVPDAINAPAAYIDADRPFIDYQQAFRDGQACWKFALTFLVNRIDEASAQDELGVVLDPFGALVTGLQDSVDAAGEAINDALTDIAAYAEVLSATRYGMYRIGHTSYYGVQIMIEVRT